ncbi:MAG: four helix bundle protein [Planctomycetota bacterium]|nr:four helix bundle protein [Planctomycetota bacterium]
MANVKRVEDLIAWQRAMELARVIYKVSASLPYSERFGLQSQIRRAAVSVPSNIAEGFGRESTTELLRFRRVARGSLFELRTQLRLSVDLSMLPSDAIPTDLVDETDRVLQALIRSLEAVQASRETR